VVCAETAFFRIAVLHVLVLLVAYLSYKWLGWRIKRRHGNVSFTMSRTKHTHTHYIFRSWVWRISLLPNRPPPNSFNLYRGVGEMSFRWSRADGTGSWPLGSSCVASYRAHRQLVFAFISSAFDTYGTVVFMCTSRFNIQNFCISGCGVLMCFVFLKETAIVSPKQEWPFENKKRFSAESIIVTWCWITTHYLQP